MTLEVLLVDDDPMILATLHEVMAYLKWPVHVETAVSGTEARERLAAKRYDLVISDERMPGLSGIELLEWLRLTSPRTVRVLMTAYREPSIRKEAQARAGVDAFLAKPFSVSQLKPVLETARDRRGSPRGSLAGILGQPDVGWEP